MNAQTTKSGLTLNQVSGNQDWFLVEYDDGSATIHVTYEEAMIAGNFDEKVEAR